MCLSDLFAPFLKEKEFLVGISPKTVRLYQQAFNAYQRVLGESGQFYRDDVPTKDTLKDFVIGMREEGLSAGACNMVQFSLFAKLGGARTRLMSCFGK